MLSEYVTHDQTWWREKLLLAGEGAQYITAKLDIVRNYMKDSFNIDIDVLRATVLRRQAVVFSGKLDLYDISIK